MSIYKKLAAIINLNTYDIYMFNFIICDYEKNNKPLRRYMIRYNNGISKIIDLISELDDIEIDYQVAEAFTYLSTNSLDSLRMLQIIINDEDLVVRDIEDFL